MDFIHEQIHKKLNDSDSFYSTIKDYDFIDNENNPRIKEEIDDRVMAKKKYRTDKSYKYLIRLNNIKSFYNPLTVLPENKSNRLLSVSDDKSPTFKEVNKNIFDMYLIFLKTLNPAWIRNAEREGF